MTTVPRRDSVPVWPGPYVNHGPPPFQGAPPPMPAGYGYNQQQWAQGVWVQNPQWNPRQYPAHSNQWMPGASWGPHPAFPQPGYPGGPLPAAQQQANFNPYKRQVKAPSMEYLSQPISDNGLQLESLVEAPDRYGDAAQLGGAKTPWIWNPLTLSNDGESPARPSRQNSTEDNASVTDSGASVSSSDYDSSSTERGTRRNYSPPSRHASEPVVSNSRNPAPPIAAPLARHATEPVVGESFTTKMELRPTFSPSVVVTPEHYKSPRAGRLGSSASLHSAYNQGEHGTGSGSVDALSEQLHRTRFDSFSSTSSGASSGMFSSPATASSFSSYGSGSGSFGNGVSPSKSTHPTHGESRSIAGLAALSDEPESYPEPPAEILSPIRLQSMLPPPTGSGRRKNRHAEQKHEPSPLRREATEPVLDSTSPLATIPEQYGGYDGHRRRRSSRQGSMEPEDNYLSSGYRQGSSGRIMTPPSPQVTPRPAEDHAYPSSYHQSHSRTPSRQGSASSYYETPSRKGSSSSRYSPPDSASRRPSSRQNSGEPERHHPLTPPEPQSRNQFEPADQAAHLRPYNPLPDPPRFHEKRDRTPPLSQPSYEENFVLHAAPNTRSGSYSSHIYASGTEDSGSHVYPTPHDGPNARVMPPVTPKRSPPGSSFYPSSATSPQVQQPTPRHTPQTFNPHAHLQLPISPRVSRTPVPVDQPPIPLPALKNVPMQTPPNIQTVARNVRAGYWNKRGDHLTSTGYVVYAPKGMQYPNDLKDYPEVGDGYKDEQGITVYHEDRPELINSISRNGLPPVTPYSEFISYRTRHIPVTRPHEIPS